MLMMKNVNCDVSKDSPIAGLKTVHISSNNKEIYESE